MNLEEAVAKAPIYTGPRSRVKWHSYHEPFIQLIEKNYPITEACRFIAREAGLSDEDAKKLHNTAKNWIRKYKQSKQS